MKTKSGPHAPEQMATATTKTLNHGHLSGLQERPPIDSKKGESEWLKNAKRRLNEMQEDSERFRKGIAEAKENLKVLKMGLKELDERNVLTDKGIASVRLRILEMESDLAQTRAIGFEGPRSARISKRDGATEIGMEATTSDIPVSETLCNEPSADSQFETPGERKMASNDEEAARKRV